MKEFGLIYIFWLWKSPFVFFLSLENFKHTSFRSLLCQKYAHGGRLGRRGWDGGKHQCPGILPVPLYKITQAPKSYFAWPVKKCAVPSLVNEIFGCRSDQGRKMLKITKITIQKKKKIVDFCHLALFLSQSILSHYHPSRGWRRDGRGEDRWSHCPGWNVSNNGLCLINQLKTSRTKTIFVCTRWCNNYAVGSRFNCLSKRQSYRRHVRPSVYAIAKHQLPEVVETCGLRTYY